MKCKIEVEGCYGKIIAELEIDTEIENTRSSLDEQISKILDAAGVIDEPQIDGEDDLA